MDTESLNRALACLDIMTPRPTKEIAAILWPDRQFKTQEVAGATVRPFLTELAWQGLARRTPQGWVRLEAANINPWGNDGAGLG